MPVVLALFFFGGKYLQNIVLLLASLFFYAWGSVSHSFIFLASIIFNYGFGLLIGNSKVHGSKVYLVIAIVFNLGLLGYFKYFNFFIENINAIFLGDSNGIKVAKVVLPIGISFFTFHALSYVIDVYRKRVTAQRNIIDMGLYMSFFPQLIAGPIVRYVDIQEQLKQRVLSLDKATAGLQRFVFGFAKKILVANTMGYLADQIFEVPTDQVSTGLAWLGITAYSLHIYFDFSGYSDMAIGLAQVFGFHFPENFNYPYIAKSIKEFWQRWHISLSTWFKDFLYIPLGGNQKGEMRTVINLLIVFFCTGFWHGANWTFVVWGMFHGVFLLIEKFGMDRLLAKTYTPVRIGYTLLVVMVGWVFFKAENMHIAVGFLERMFFVPSGTHLRILTAADFWDLKTVLVMIVAILYSFRVYRWSIGLLQNSILFRTHPNSYSLFFESTKVLMSASLFFVTLVYLASGTYNPFIYFRF